MIAATIIRLRPARAASEALCATARLCSVACKPGSSRSSCRIFRACSSWSVAALPSSAPIENVPSSWRAQPTPAVSPSAAAAFRAMRSACTSATQRMRRPRRPRGRARGGRRRRSVLPVEALKAPIEHVGLLECRASSIRLCARAVKSRGLVRSAGHAFGLGKRLLGCAHDLGRRRLAQGKRKLAGIDARRHRRHVGASPLGSADLEREAPDLNTARDPDGHGSPFRRSSVAC